MSLTDWLNEKFIEKHRPSALEIANLLHICDRDLEKCRIPELGPDWRLSIAHNAALQAATAALQDYSVFGFYFEKGQSRY